MQVIEIRNGQTIQIKNNFDIDLTIAKAEGEVFLHEGENYFGPFVKVYKEACNRKRNFCLLDLTSIQDNILIG